MGLPLEGHKNIPRTLSTSSLLHLHGRSDETIPFRGGWDFSHIIYIQMFIYFCSSLCTIYIYSHNFSTLNREANGWVYVSSAEMVSTWASVAGGVDRRPASTPFDGGQQNLACEDFASSQSAARVLRCLYDGKHEWPASYESMAYWFFNETIRGRIQQEAATPIAYNNNSEELLWSFESKFGRL